MDYGSPALLDAVALRPACSVIDVGGSAEVLVDGETDGLVGSGSGATSADALRLGMALCDG